MKWIIILIILVIIVAFVLISVKTKSTVAAITSTSLAPGLKSAALSSADAGIQFGQLTQAPNIFKGGGDGTFNSGG